MSEQAEPLTEEEEREWVQRFPMVGKRIWATIDALRAEVKRWEEGAFHACAGLVSTPEKPTQDPCRSSILVELRELCEARGKSERWFEKRCAWYGKETDRLKAELSRAREATAQATRAAD